MIERVSKDEDFWLTAWPLWTRQVAARRRCTGRSRWGKPRMGLWPEKPRVLSATVGFDISRDRDGRAGVGDQLISKDGIFACVSG